MVFSCRFSLEFWDFFLHLHIKTPVVNSFNGNPYAWDPFSASGAFVNGVAEGEIEETLQPVSALRLVFQSDSDLWALLSEVWSSLSLLFLNDLHIFVLILGVLSAAGEFFTTVRAFRQIGQQTQNNSMNYLLLKQHKSAALANMTKIHFVFISFFFPLCNRNDSRSGWKCPESNAYPALCNVLQDGQRCHMIRPFNPLV